jgi:hypothetical protein
MSTTNGDMTHIPIATRRRRFLRVGQPNAVELSAAGESLSSLRAELVILREENARLKAGKHQPLGVGELLERTRSLTKTAVHGDNLVDETAQMLAESLVIRESLLEICREFERLMVALAGKLSALESPTAALRSVPAPHEVERAQENGRGAA